MRRIAGDLTGAGLRSAPVLQIDDELLIQVPTEVIEPTTTIVERRGEKSPDSKYHFSSVPVSD